MSVKLKIIPFILTIPLLLICFFPAMSIAHNKVVVIPVLGEDKILDPLRPLAKSSPPDSHYSAKAGIVTDTVTGLEWQQTPSHTLRNWNQSMSYCGSLDLDGIGWRLPEVFELMSIVDYGNSEPSINDSAFISNRLRHFWTATTNATYTPNAWYINFSYGDNSTRYKEDEFGYYSRCVRGSRPTGPVLVDNGNGTVTDLVSGIIWQQQDDNVLRNWVEARSYCGNLVLGNESNWRMPEVKELASIVDYRDRYPSIDEYKFPGTNESGYWAYTGHESIYTQAWRVDFQGGHVYPFEMLTNYLSVRCVVRGR